VTIELGSVLGAITVAVLAIVGWAGPRWTKEGRLLARIRRLGDAHAALPESSERARLGVTLTELARDLNAWNAADQRMVRRWRIGAPIGALLIAYAIVLAIWPAMNLDLRTLWVWSLVIGAIAGIMAVVVTQIVERLVVSREIAALRVARERAFLRGESPAPT